VKRQHPDTDEHQLETMRAEIIKAGNIASGIGERIEDYLDEYLRSTD
ncbi:DNA packaging protein, partial [Shewanella sp. Iso12]|nr:DNA packaging protein [Shewanella sp. Iso12]